MVKILMTFALLTSAGVNAESLGLGKTENGIFYAKGIPYAEPPEGDLRWAPPVDKVFEKSMAASHQYGSDCFATVGFLSAAAEQMNENCLFLNVWTPNTDKKLPVMFWIHGGGLSQGHGRLHGEVLAKHGVVVVSINYRLGPLGFFVIPQHKNSDPNYALLDMISALQWVKRHISFFGGDPENITIFGNSAGGLAVDLLVTHPKARGLFHRAIAQSSYITGELSYLKKISANAPKKINGEPAYIAEQESLALLKRIGLKGTESLGHLRSIDAQKIVNAQRRGIAPIVDGESVKLDILSCIRSPVCGTGLKTYMAGGTSWEGDFAQYVEGFLEGQTASLKRPRKDTTKVYPKDISLGGEEIALARFLGDQYFLLSAKKTASAHVNNKTRVYTYIIDFPVSTIKNYVLGTPHGWDTGALWWSPFSTDDMMITAGEQLRASWVRLAYGLPLQGDGDWQPWSGEKHYWQKFGNDGGEASGLIKSRLDYAESFYQLREN